MIGKGFTTVNGGCTAVCDDNLLNNCQVNCGGDLNAIMTAKAVLPVVKRADSFTVTVTNGGCTAVCWDKVGAGTECNVNCESYTSHLHYPTPKPTPLEKRGYTKTVDGCTAVCWDLMPGTGCDVQCRESGLTKMPSSTSGVTAGWKTTITTEGCTAFCADLNPGSECEIFCSGSLPTKTPGKISVFVPRSFLLYRHSNNPQKLDFFERTVALLIKSSAMLISKNLHFPPALT